MTASRLLTLGLSLPLSGASLWLLARYAHALGANAAHFMPHGYCYMWDPRIVWLHVITDALIGFAYYFIPVILVWFIRKNNLPFNLIFWLFAGFILTCGTTHFMEIWNIWHGDYIFAGAVKAITAVLSVLTAWALIRLMPKAMALPALQTQVEILNLARVMVRDTKGRIEVWSGGNERLYGYTREEAVGQISHELLQTQFPMPLEEIDRLLERDGTWEGELLHRTRDGRQIIVAAGWVLHQVGHGKSLVMESSSDLTTRKQIEQGLAKKTEELIRSQQTLEGQTEKLESVLKSMTGGLVAVDTEGKFVLWNVGATKLLGLGATPLPAHAWAEHYGFFMNDTVTPLPSEQTPLMCALGGAATRREMFVRNERIPEGAYIEIYGSPRFDVSGAVCGGVTAFRDISQLKEDERQIRKLNDDLERSVIERTTQLKTAIAETSDQQFALNQHAIVEMTDLRGTITYVNEKFCTLSQYSQEELVGQNHRMLNSGHHRKEFFNEMYHTIARGKVWHGEIRNRAKDGSSYWVDTTIIPTLDDESKPRQYVAIRADVTERKRAEEDLVRLHREMEARNLKLEDQTAELQRTRDDLECRVIMRTEALNKANETLANSNIELQQFAYIASHDLQSPLRSISGFVQLLKLNYENRLDERGLDWIYRTVQAIEQMQALIQDLLAYSRVDSRHRPFVPTPFLDVFNDTVGLLEATIRDAGAHVTCGDLPVVVGDRSQLVQLMDNLIGNGIKYHGDKTPRVHVSAEHTGNEWTFSVRDNGIGISPKYHERIFEMFQRLHNRKEYPGTGIGLAVCRRIVDGHGGRIWADSEPGQGSSFHFTIPAGPEKPIGPRTDQ